MEIISIGIKHIYCCEKPRYTKYIISVSQLLPEDLSFIKDYNDSYFMEDHMLKLYERLPDLAEISINENEYNQTNFKHSHVHC